MSSIVQINCNGKLVTGPNEKRREKRRLWSLDKGMEILEGMWQIESKATILSPVSFKRSKVVLINHKENI
jgi:hypothetical protein